MRRTELGQAGIYSIVNTVTGQTYIGLAGTSIGMRWSVHKSNLNRKCHPNRLLQEDWNHFGAVAFELRILEVFLNNPDRGERMRREKAHFDAATGELYNL